MKITPISEFGRVPEQGRIRYGVKVKSTTPGKKDYAKALLKFRFTSSDTTALEQISELYGGKVLPWEKGQHEVLSAASEVPIILPPDPLQGGPVYELWAGGTCIRRCDGVTATVTIKDVEGAYLDEVPCVCAQENKLSCKATTRLSVILPEIRFGGLWRLDCKGWYGANELPPMVAMAQQMLGQGMSRAYLALVQRDRPGKKFVVPVIRMQQSPNEMANRQLGPSAPVLELESGEPNVFDA